MWDERDANTAARQQEIAEAQAAAAEAGKESEVFSTSNVPTYDQVEGIGGSVGNIEKSIDATQEDIKSLVDVAERRYVNNINLTAQTPVINVNGQNTGRTAADRQNLAIIMYDWQDTGAGDNRGNADHVGMVAAVNGTALTIIEGNNGNSVAYRTLQVNGRYIRGYCLPDYASKATEKGDTMANEAGEWSKEARDWAVSIGLIKGAGTLPDGSPDYQWKRQPTREELVEVLHRFAVHIGRA